MTNYAVADIRTVAMVGHNAVGKTSLIDAMLFEAKAVERRGSVDDGTSVSDFDEESRARKCSIDSNVMHCDWNGRHLYLVDTPGAPDFVGAALPALRATEVAVVVIHAAAGVQVNTRRLFAEAGKRGCARAVVINRIDAENADIESLLGQIQEILSPRCLPANLPVGKGEGTSGVANVLEPAAAPPVGVQGDLAAARAAWMDAIVEVDEQLMTRYLEGEAISADVAAQATTTAIIQGSLIPVLCCSARKGVGVKELLDFVAAYFPNPQQVPREAVADAQAGSTVALVPDPAAPFIGQVFKIVNDRFIGKLSFIRVFQGTLRADQTIQSLRHSKPSRIGHLSRVQGKTHVNIAEAVAGEIVAVSKVEDLAFADTVSHIPNIPAIAPIEVPVPMVDQAVEPKSRNDEQKISGSLHTITDEDPTFRTRRDRETKELVVTGMGHLHLDVIRHRLKRRFELEVIAKIPKVPYRETIVGSSEASYRHKKQSGGRGQFAEVHLRLKPLERGKGFEFIDAVVGGSIPNQFIPAVEKGVRETLETGVLAGYHVDDVAAEVFYGKYHDVDSSEAAFKLAGSHAFKEAFMLARPALLEPIVTLEITAPVSNMGDISSDLSSRRARIVGTDTLAGGLQVITATAPLAELLDYSARLGSMTGGQGTYSIKFDHYDVTPGNVQQQVIERHKKEVEAARA